MTLPSDELLLAAFAKGDRQAFDRLTSRYSAELDAFFRRRLPDDGRIEELRQETLLALYALLPSYQEKGRFRSLLFAIAYRKLVSARRQERPTAELSPDFPAAGSDPVVFEIHSAVQALPEGLREALVLTRFEGLSSAEAAEVLGCSSEAVRARVCRAKSLLARRLEPQTRRKS
jgi:RNA polymerase sigma-70 factor (ECF subfamily)